MSHTQQLPVIIDGIQITIPKFIKIKNLPLSPKYKKINDLLTLDTFKEDTDEIPQILLPKINPRPPPISTKRKKEIRNQLKFIDINYKNK